MERVKPSEDLDHIDGGVDLIMPKSYVTLLKELRPDVSFKHNTLLMYSGERRKCLLNKDYKCPVFKPKQVEKKKRFLIF